VKGWVPMSSPADSVVGTNVLDRRVDLVLRRELDDSAGAYRRV